jgi:outer membrane receptor protein involved in Fe transport
VPSLVQASGSTGAYSGNQLPLAPHLATSEAIQYNFVLGGAAMFARAEHQYLGRSNTDFTPSTGLAVGDYSIFNARVGAMFGHWDVAVFGTNLADSRGIINATTQNFFAVANEAFRVPPRTVGITVRWKVR